MSKSPYTVEQRLSFINDCYTSGLTVHSWCKEKDIPPGTFYSWLHYLKKQGHQLPDVVPVSLRDKPVKESHEVVKVNIVEETRPLANGFNHSCTAPEPICDRDMHSITIHVADATLDIADNVNPAFLTQILRAVRYSV